MGKPSSSASFEVQLSTTAPANHCCRPIGHDLHAPCLGIKRRSHRFPPTPDGFHGEGRRVMVCPTYPAHVVGQIINSIGICGPSSGMLKSCTRTFSGRLRVH